MRRAPVAICLAAVLAAGCQSKPASDVAVTAPPPPPPPPTGTPRVELDSTNVVAVRRDRSQLTFFVTNVGDAAAYHVRGYWHFAGDAAVHRVDDVPPTLPPGQSGVMPIALDDATRATWPVAPDSIRWSSSL